MINCSFSQQKKHLNYFLRSQEKSLNDVVFHKLKSVPDVDYCHFVHLFLKKTALRLDTTRIYHISELGQHSWQHTSECHFWDKFRFHDTTWTVFLVISTHTHTNIRTHTFPLKLFVPLYTMMHVRWMPEERSMVASHIQTDWEVVWGRGKCVSVWVSVWA